MSAAFDVAGARSTGYTDDEIVSFLARSGKVPFDFEGASKAGYTPTEVLDHIATRPAQGKPTGTNNAVIDVPAAVAPIKQGAADFVSGVGETLKQYTPFGGAAQAAKDAAGSIAPKGYERAQVLAPKTSDDQSLLSRVQPGQLPKAVAEQAPAMGASILAARLGARVHPLAGALLAAGVYGASALGNRAKERAAEETGDANAEPTTRQKAIAAGTVIPEAALASIAAARFLPGAGRASTVTGALGKGAATAGVEAGVGAGQSTLAQVGRTVGTPGGLHVDPDEVATQAIVQGATGGALVAPRTMRAASTAAKFRSFDPEISRVVANDLDAAAQGDLKYTRNGYQAVRDVEINYKEGLRSAAAQLKKEDGPLPLEVRAALKRASLGRQLSEGDLGAIEDAGGQQAAFVARKLSTLAALKATGEFSTADRRFVGGMGRKLERSVSIFRNPTAGGVAAGVLSGNPVGALTYAPHTVGTLAGAWATARALDALTGRRSPAKAFVDTFGGEGAAPTAASPTAATGPQVTAQRDLPWGPRPSEPTGPRIPSTPGAADVVTTARAIRKASSLAAVGPGDHPVGDRLTVAKAFTKLGDNKALATAAENAPSSPAAPSVRAAPPPDWMTAHDKAHLSPRDAAEAIADQWTSEGRSFKRSREAFVGQVSRVLSEKVKVAHELEKLTGLDQNLLLSHLWSVRDRAEARATIDKLVAHAPKSEEAIRAVLGPKVDRWWKLESYQEPPPVTPGRQS